MLATLLRLKEFCEKWSINNPDLFLSEEQWELISEIVISLEPAKKAMTKLQPENLPLTDYRKIWEICHVETVECGKHLIIKNNLLRISFIYEDSFCRHLILSRTS